MYERICLGAFLRSFANTKRAVFRPRTHFLNVSFAFIVVLSFFLVGDDSLMGKRRMCVNRFIVMAQALDEFHPIHFWPQTLYIFGAHTTNMRTAYLLLATLLLDLHTMLVRSQLPQLLRGAGVKIRSLSTPPT